MAYVEASLDFSDEQDIADKAFAEALPQVKSLVAQLEHALADGRRGEIIREGIQVAIVGAPNVGKSSLLNALAGREAAIVWHEPGTTRDVIEIALDLNDFPFVLLTPPDFAKPTAPWSRKASAARSPAPRPPMSSFI